MRLAGSLERSSEHPLAAAIVSGARDRGIQLVDATAFESSTGKGVTGEVEGRRVALGNRSLFEAFKLDSGELGARAEQLRAGGQTIMFVVVDDKRRNPSLNIDNNKVLILRGVGIFATIKIIDCDNGF